jgi:glycine/D-amino acid oxidase-like deaminating enzyme
MAMWSSQAQKRVDACDVVIVGAGLVGAAVAARLAQRGMSTAILEAQSVAGGASGRSTGIVLTGLPGHYSWAISAYGRQKAREIWALTVEGRERLVETANRLNVPVQHTGSLALAVEESEADVLRESAVLLDEDGFEARFNPRDILERGFRAALRQPDDVTVDAAELTRALLDSSGVAIHEGTEVYDLEAEGGDVRVWAQGRTVLCNAAVLAVNGYAPLISSYFADKVAPTRALVFATDPLESVVLDVPCCADYGYEACRQLPDRRLLLSSWRRPRAMGDQESGEGTGLDDVVQAGLARFAEHHFSDIELRGADRWSGVIGFTSDGLPLVGTLPHLPQVYFAVGLGGRGLAWAFAVAERLIELMWRDTDPGILSATR